MPAATIVVMALASLLGSPHLPLSLFRAWARRLKEEQQCRRWGNAACRVCFQSGAKGRVPAAPTAPSTRTPGAWLVPSLLWALLSLPASPGPWTSGIIMVGLPVPPARIFAALGVVFNSALSNLVSRSWWQYFYSSAWKLDTWGHTLYKQYQGCWATVAGGGWQTAKSVAPRTRRDVGGWWLGSFSVLFRDTLVLALPGQRNLSVWRTYLLPSLSCLLKTSFLLFPWLGQVSNIIAF